MHRSPVVTVPVLESGDAHALRHRGQARLAGRANVAVEGCKSSSSGRTRRSRSTLSRSRCRRRWRRRWRMSAFVLPPPASQVSIILVPVSGGTGPGLRTAPCAICAQAVTRRASGSQSPRPPARRSSRTWPGRSRRRRSGRWRSGQRRLAPSWRFHSEKGGVAVAG